jgi:uncharacterized alkaline shock family protein YloU
MRQRVRSHTSPLRVVGRLLVLVLAGALLWYGAMTALAAAKLVSLDTADRLSGFRTAFGYLAGLTPDDFGSTTRLIIAAVGVVAFLVFGWLALKELPHPHLARGALELHEDARGVASIEPRAIERIAETAAAENTAVTRASGRYGTDDVAVTVSVRRARDAADTLRDVQSRVRSALEQHGLPTVPVNVTLTGFDRKQRRELQ